MDSAHTSQITLNRRSSHVSFKAGVPSRSPPSLTYLSYPLRSFRCTAPRNDLDGVGGLRAHLLTEQLIHTLDVRTLWEDYGIVANVLVSRTLLLAFNDGVVQL